MSDSDMENISLKLPDKLKEQAENAAEEGGFANLSEFARHAIRRETERTLLTARKLDEDSELLSAEEAIDKIQEEKD